MKIIFLSLGLWLCSFAWSAEHDHATSDSQFQLEGDLANTLYEEVLEDAGIDEASVASGMRIDFYFNYVSTTDLFLSNRYFDINYTDSFSSVPSFRLNVNYPIVHAPLFKVYLAGSVGYGRKVSLTEVKSKSGGIFRDMIQLNWLPLSAGFRGEATWSRNAPVCLFLEAGVGVQWLYQSGKLDRSLEQGFWVPFYRASTGLAFFKSVKAGDWFGGINVGVSLMRSFHATQTANAWSADVGASLQL